MRARSQHILLAALFLAGLIAAPFGGLAAQSLPGDEFEPPIAAVEALSPEELADVRAFAGAMPDPSEEHGWRAEELDNEEQVVRPPERQAADLYRTPPAPECVLRGPGAVAGVAGSGAPFMPDSGAAGQDCCGDLWPGAARHSLRPASAVSGRGFLLNKVYFSIRNGYVGRDRIALRPVLPTCPPEFANAPHPAPLSVIVPTTVTTSPEFLV